MEELAHFLRRIWPVHEAQAKAFEKAVEELTLTLTAILPPHEVDDLWFGFADEDHLQIIDVEISILSKVKSE